MLSCTNPLSSLHTRNSVLHIAWRHTASKWQGSTSGPILLKAQHVHSCSGGKSKLCFPQACRLVREKKLLKTEPEEPRPTVWMSKLCEGWATETLYVDWQEACSGMDRGIHGASEITGLVSERADVGRNVRLQHSKDQNKTEGNFS